MCLETILLDGGCPKSTADNTLILNLSSKTPCLIYRMLYTVDLLLEKSPKFQSLNVSFYWLVPIINIF